MQMRSMNQVFAFVTAIASWFIPTYVPGFGALSAGPA
jgi:hypothetical protein